MRLQPTETVLTFYNEDTHTGDVLNTLHVKVRYSPGSENRITVNGPEVGDAEEIEVVDYGTDGADDEWVDSILSDQDVLLEKFHTDNESQREM